MLCTLLLPQIRLCMLFGKMQNLLWCGWTEHSWKILTRELHTQAIRLTYTFIGSGDNPENVRFTLERGCIGWWCSSLLWATCFGAPNNHNSKTHIYKVKELCRFISLEIYTCARKCSGIKVVYTAVSYCHKYREDNFYDV